MDVPGGNQVRRATAADYTALADVMFDAVHNGRSRYSEAQRRAWVPERRAGRDWIERLDAQVVLLAEVSAEVLGFMSLTAAGYIDFAYVRPAAQGTGIFRRLYEAIERTASERGDARLWVHASLMAQPAFSAMGFSVTRKEVVRIGGQDLERFAMARDLAAG